MVTRPAALAGLALVTALVAQQGGSAAPDAAEPASRTVAAVQNPRCILPGPYGYPQGSHPVDLDPSDFTTRIDNPYWPMRPGTVWRYVERGGGETQRVKVTVTRRTKLIEGIRARVVRDVVKADGEVVEDTRDWYAQDSGGSIWYLGENTKEYENGQVVSTEGSWKYGRDGAQAGVIVPARPRVGCAYREEYLAGEAEDNALILARSEAVKVPTGFYLRVLHTSNSTPLEPALLENKLYARGVGPVLEIDLSPRPSRAVLVAFRHP